MKVFRDLAPLLAFLISLPINGSENLQRQSDFEQAIRNSSTSPWHVKVAVVNSRTNQRRTICTNGDFLMGAIHREHGIPYTSSGIKKAESLALNSSREYIFKRKSAISNIPPSFVQTERNQAIALVRPLTDKQIRADFKGGGKLREFYTASRRYGPRMDALACALIDRGFQPRIADISGQLYLQP